MGFICDIKYEYSKKCAEPLFPTGKFKILVVQNTDLLISILPEINIKLHVNLLCQVVQNPGGPKLQNTDGARATSVF